MPRPALPLQVVKVLLKKMKQVGLTEEDLNDDMVVYARSDDATQDL